MQIQNLKLTGNILLAPMAGITDLPYRRIMRPFGVALAYSEMVSANGLIRDGRRTLELLRSCAADRPLAVQLFGSDPQIMAKAAGMVEEYGELIDINMGCPVPKVVRSGSGSALMRTPERVEALVTAVRRATSRPLTVKIRSGWDMENRNFLEIARIAVDAGADAVTLHPRTRSQGFGGEANWDDIATLKRAISVPVIGSGDIFSADDAVTLLGVSRCDAIMIGRGGYGNPWLIAEIAARQKGEVFTPISPEEKGGVAREHLTLSIEELGEKRALREMRKHLCWYSRGLAGAAQFRMRVNSALTFAQLNEEIDTFFTTASRQEENQPHVHHG